MDIPIYANELIKLSSHEFFLYPDHKPSGIASKSDKIIELPISMIVAGRRCINCGHTADLLDKDTPKSPCTARLAQAKYCSVMLLSNPNCAITLAFCSSVISGFTYISDMSPGAK